MSSTESVEIMKATIQIPSTIEAAHKFIEHMRSQGYEPVLENKDDFRENYYFTLNGKTSIHYEVNIFPQAEEGSPAFIGVRPL